MMDDIWFEKESRKFHEKGEINNDGAIKLAAAIIDEIKKEVSHVIRAYKMNPDDSEVRDAVNSTDELLNSEYFYILTMGHGGSLRDYFERKCDLDGRKD